MTELFNQWLHQVSHGHSFDAQLAIIFMFAIAFGLIGWSLRASMVRDHQSEGAGWAAEQGEAMTDRFHNEGEIRRGS